MKRISSYCSSSSCSSCVHLEPNNGSFCNLLHHHHHPQSKRARSTRGKNEENTLSINNGNEPSLRIPGKRSSIFRGVTKHRWTGRFEAHLWDKSTWNSVQRKKGRQIYLGAYDNEEAAARTYDLAALKYWGPGTILNFEVENYAKEIEEMKKVSREEYLASLRRQSSGFSRGVSKYRGVARHHHNGRWEARIGRVHGNKYLYLGTYSTQEEAAIAYDRAAIEYRGANAVTNFDLSTYMDKLYPFQQQGQLENPASSEARDEKQGLQENAEAKQEAEQNVSDIEVVSAPAQPVGMIEPVEPADNENDHPWNFLMDLGFNSSFPVSDIPMEKSTELPDLFPDIGFEDDIDFIFDDSFNVNECKIEAEPFGGALKEGGTSPSDSSSSSTITSSGSNNSSA